MKKVILLHCDINICYNLSFLPQATIVQPYVIWILLFSCSVRIAATLEDIMLKGGGHAVEMSLSVLHAGLVCLELISSYSALDTTKGSR